MKWRTFSVLSARRVRNQESPARCVSGLLLLYLNLCLQEMPHGSAYAQPSDSTISFVAAISLSLQSLTL